MLSTSPAQPSSLGRFLHRIFLRPLDAIILIVIWAVVNGSLYIHYGIKVMVDSPRYPNYAQRIIDGLGWYEPHNVWYLGYVLFVLVVKTLFQSNTAIIVAQVLAHGIAALALYRTSYRLFASRSAALVTALLFLAWIEIPAWNFYVLAESWYVSLTCLVLYCIVSFNGSPVRWLTTTGIVLLTFITKPTGIAVLIAYGVFLVNYYHLQSVKFKPVLYLLVLLILPLVYSLINQMLASFVLIEQYTTGEVVYGMSVVQGYAGKEQLVLPVEHLFIPSTEWAPIPRLLVFIIYNPLFFIELSLTKAWYFLNHTRPYYSRMHNAFTMITLYPLYFLAGKTLWQSKLSSAFKKFCLVFMAIHIVAIMFTTVDWDGRFLMPVLPLMFLLGGGGIVNIRRFVLTRRC